MCSIDFLCMYRQDNENQGFARTKSLLLPLFLCINHFATNQVFARTTKSYKKITSILPILMARHATTQLQRPEDNVQELLSRTRME